MPNNIPNLEEKGAWLPASCSPRYLLLVKPTRDNPDPVEMHAYNEVVRAALRTTVGATGPMDKVASNHPNYMFPSTYRRFALLYNVEFSGSFHGTAHNWWWNSGMTSTQPASMVSPMPDPELYAIQKAWSNMMQELQGAGVLNPQTLRDLDGSHYTVFNKDAMFAYDWTDPQVENKLAAGIQIYIHSPRGRTNRGISEAGSIAFVCRLPAVYSVTIVCAHGADLSAYVLGLTLN